MEKREWTSRMDVGNKDKEQGALSPHPSK